jgi:hypothetical protein
MVHFKWLVVGSLIGLPACVPFFALAPGAELVRVTNVPADVAGCAPVGNIQVPRSADGLVAIHHALGQMKNQAVGFGGNAAFVTEGTLGIPLAGVAYLCPSPADSNR